MMPKISSELASDSKIWVCRVVSSQRTTRGFIWLFAVLLRAVFRIEFPHILQSVLLIVLVRCEFSVSCCGKVG